MPTPTTKNLPNRKAEDVASRGKEYLLDIATLSADNKIEWVRIKGQRGASLSQKADTMDASDKTSGEWKSEIAGMKSWSVEYDGLVNKNDEGMQLAEKAFRASTDLLVRIVDRDNAYQWGLVSVTEFSKEYPFDDMASLKATFSGIGAISEETSEELTPESAGINLTVTPALAKAKV